VLELDRLTKSYGSTLALDGLSFSVEPGQILGFVGPNGAGKTTAMRIVIGVLEPDSGAVRWDGQQIGPERRRRIGYMPEERGLYPKMRVADQLTYMAELHGLDAGSAARNARAWIERLGLSERARERTEALSLGNQQRAQLAAALVHEPELLVLDEPFSGLDPIGVDLLSEVLVAEARERGVPVVFSSHQLELVDRLCDAVAIIRGGRLVVAGEVEALKRERAGRRWRLELAGHQDFEPDLPGVVALGGGLFELGDETRPQELLDAGRRAGEVVRFGPEVPALADLFREAVEQ
jgi:ABC-2 type transport system ATP-binding protein